MLHTEGLSVLDSNPSPLGMIWIFEFCFSLHLYQMWLIRD